MKNYIAILVAFIAGVLMFNSCGNNAEKRAIENAARERAEFVRDSVERAKIAEEKRAKEIADSIAFAKHINEIKNSVKLTSYWLSSANSCGGRDIHFNYQNLSKTKTIKYLVFSVTFYNAVGDLAYDEIRDYCHFNGKDTGPIKPMGYGSDGYWECAIYNYQAKKMALNKIVIDYTDGTKLEINENELKYVKGYKG